MRDSRLLAGRFPELLHRQSISGRQQKIRLEKNFLDEDISLEYTAQSSGEFAKL